MALERKDALGDQTATTGTGTLTLADVAPVGYVAFTGRVTDGATVRYRVQNEANTEWEVNEGVWTAATKTLTRGTPTQSSNAGALVNFSAGSKAVVLVLTAADLDGKQDTLVSGTNVKTVNGSSLLGSGNLAVSASPAGANTQVQVNVSGAFGGSAALTHSGSTLSLGYQTASALLKVGYSATRDINISADSSGAFICNPTVGTFIGAAFGVTLAESSNTASGGATNGFKFSRDGITIGRWIANGGDTGAVAIAFDDHFNDRAASALTIRAGQAYTAAATNRNGGNLNLVGGAGASASASTANGGNVNIDGGQGYGTGSPGDIYVGNTRGNLRVMGLTFLAQRTNATEPSWINGASFFNTDLDKLRIGGASAWETVTSA